IRDRTSIDVVVGGPPCQGFSISGKRNPDDPRNLLYKSFLRVIADFRPKAIVMENVPNMVSMSQGRIKEQILTDFEHLGYQVQYKILLASDYGVPQNRRRVVFVGVPKNYKFNFPIGDFTEKKITCSQAMNDLPEDSMTDGEPYPINPLSSYQKLMRIGSSQVYNHQITKHTEKTINTIAMVPDGGNYKDLPKHLQGTRKVNIAWTRYSSHKPSLTIDTGHRHHFHYQWNRVPTVRESARLQSFPDSFIFYGSKTSQYKQVGNAVPPLMAKAIAYQLYSCLN
ncbi:MAG: DNA cytosine methyltransferase, partial [Xenococcus sp. (in: cyanobacteria)]